MKTIRLFTVLIFLVSQAVMAIIPNTDSIDTQNAVTIPRASFNISVWGYNNGGLLTKTIIGLHDHFYLGASFDIENAIGDGQPKLNIPGVIAKWRITDGWDDFPMLLAIGYDSFYSGKTGKIKNTDNPFDRVIYGPYAVITRPIFLFGMQQNVHFGIRMPLQPTYVTENTSAWIAIDFPIGFFVPMVEIERIYFDGNRLNEILVNFGFRFNVFESLSLELNIMLANQTVPNRMLIIEFMDSF